MADETIITEVAVEGVDQSAQQLELFGDTGAAAFQRVADASRGLDDAARNMQKVADQSRQLRKIEDAAFSLGRSLRDLGSSFSGFTKNAGGIRTVAAEISGIFTRLTGISVTLGGSIVGAAAAAVPALVSLARSAANASDAIRDASIAAGTTARNFQSMSFAFEQSGSSGPKLERALARISQATGQAIEQGERSTGAFKALGIQLTNTAGLARDPTEVLKDVADRIAAITDPAQRAAVASQLFTRRLGPGLVEALSLGRKGLEEFDKEAQRLGLHLTDVQLKVGDDFNDALQKLGATAGATRTQLGLIFAPVFTEAANRFTEAIVRSRPQLIELGNTISQRLAPIIQDLVSLLTGETDKIQNSTIFILAKVFETIAGVVKNVLIPAFQGWLVILNQIAVAINAVFGTSFTGADLAALAFIIKITGAFTVLLNLFRVGINVINVLRLALLPLIAAFGPWALVLAAVAAGVALLVSQLDINWESIRTAAVSTFNSIVNGAKQLWEQIKQAWQDGTTAIVEFFKKLPENVQAVMKQAFDAIVNFIASLPDRVLQIMTAVGAAIQGAFNNAISVVKGWWNDFVNFIIDRINRVIEFFKRLVAAAKEAIAASAQATRSEGQGLAGGGPVRGPGTSTSDSIPAWLSAGEWVMRARAVQYYGRSFMNALNSMRLPRDIMGRLTRGFAEGGMVSPIPLRLADGGPVGDIGGTRQVLNLTIGGETFEDLLVPERTAQSLVRFATRKGIKSAGRKPNWYGGGT